LSVHSNLKNNFQNRTVYVDYDEITKIVKDEKNPHRFLIYGGFNRLDGYRFVEIVDDQMVFGETFSKSIPAEIINFQFALYCMNGWKLEGEFCGIFNN
jgi:hypothetical protein